MTKITIEIENGDIRVSTRAAGGSAEKPKILAASAATAGAADALSIPADALSIPADVLERATAVNATNGGPAPSFDPLLPTDRPPPASLGAAPAQSAGAARAEGAFDQ